MYLFLLVLSFFCTAYAGGDVFPAPGAKKAPQLDFSLLPESASEKSISVSGKEHPVQARLISDRIEVRQGSFFRLGLYLVQDEGWHTYWKSPGTIGQPTDITWSLPEGSTNTQYQYPIPSYFEQSDIVSIGYEEEVLLFTEVELPKNIPVGEHDFVVSARWLVCKESCIPGKTELTLPILVGEKNVGSAYAPLFDHYDSLLPERPVDVKEFAVETVLSADGILPNTPFQFGIQITPTGTEPLHFEQNKGTWPMFTPITGDFWMINETSIRKTENGGIRIIFDAESFEAEEYPAEDRIGGLFQIKVGDKWIRTEVEAKLPLVAPDTKVTALQSPILSSKTTDSEEKPASEDPSEKKDVPEEATSSETSEMSLAQALLFAFFGGALLNIMPCVLPVLTLKLFGLVEQSDITPREQKIAGIAYSSGIVASFLALALFVVILQTAFGLNIGWGFQFQYPAYVIALATIVFVFGLSLLGVFEVPTIGANKANEMSNKSGWLEYFMIGVFATLLATPCSAPFLGTGIGFAFTLPAWGIFAFFAIAGLGLASPFLVVAFYPPFFKILPQPGAWMDTFKQLMGFTLIGTTVWLIDVLGAQTGIEGTTGFLIFLVFVSLSAWIFGKWGSVMETGARQLQMFGLGILVSGAAGFFFLKTDFAETGAPREVADINQLDFSEEMPWQPFSDAAITKLREEKKAIFIDFTADWCLSCKVNEKNVLETETVRNALKEKGVVPVKADWTRRDEEISTWLKRYGKAGVPFYLIIGSDGKAHPLPEVLTTGIVLDALEKAS